jgi:agmatine deiminase
MPLRATLPALALLLLLGCPAPADADDDSADPTAARRVPAEWEPHAATWMQWPGPWEAELRPVFARIVDVVQDYEPVQLLVGSAAEQEQARQFLAGQGVSETNVSWHVVPIDNAWLRDNGPIYVTDGGETWIEDFGFDGWGGHFGADVPFAADDAVPAWIGEHLGVAVVDRSDYVLEKGNLEFNGGDVVVLNHDCQDDRNPGLSEAEHEAILREAFGVSTVVWAYGHHPLDGTTGHIDGTARFVAEDTLAVADSTWGAATEDPLVDAAHDAGLEVVRVPCPGDTDYMNWLVGDGFVAAMAFGDADADAAAQAALESLFPGRDVHMIDAGALWDSGGGIHCVTNDQPVLP